MTQIELERIASLANHPGFLALLKVLDEADSLLLDKLYSANKKEEQELVLNLWKASRRFRKLIEGRPEELYNNLDIGAGDPY